MKRNMISVIVIVLALALVMTTACARAEFELSSLESTPSRVGTGDTATVTVDLTNVGTAEGTYAVALTLDGDLVETKDVTLVPGATQKVTFAVVKEVVGVYTVEVEGVSGTLHVVKPAEFQLSSLAVTPREVVLGDEATAAVDVRNVGELEGDYTCALLIAGVKVQRKQVRLAGGTTKTVSFTFVPEEPGHCHVTVGDLTQTIKVLKPAEFRISNLVITPSEPSVWETIKVQAAVANVGGVEGSHTITLLIDGVEIERKHITLAAGAARTVSFELVEDVTGAYQVQIDGVSETLVVRELPTVGPEKLGEVKYDIEHEITLKNEGPGVASRVMLWMSLITTQEPYQTVVLTNIRPDNYKTTEDEYGNSFAEFEFTDIGAGEEVSVEITYQVAVSQLRYHLGPCEGLVPVRFLEPEPGIESNEEEIVALAKQLTKDKLNPCEKARAIYDWIGNNIAYTGYCAEDRGALFALRNRGGDCTEFADLLIALCRAAGIPARFLTGVNPKSPSPAAETHDWAEVYLAGTGWVPVDPTWGRPKERRAHYFASVTPDHIVVSTGRNLDLLGGYYRFYYRYWWKEEKPKVSKIESWQIFPEYPNWTS